MNWFGDFGNCWLRLVTNRRVAETKAVLGPNIRWPLQRAGASGADVDVIQLASISTAHWDHWLLSVPKRAIPGKRTTDQ